MQRRKNIILSAALLAGAIALTALLSYNLGVHREKARAKGYYLQNYCGCIFSEKEKLEKKGQGASSKGNKKNV